MYTNFKMPLIVCKYKSVTICGIVFLLSDWWTRDGGRDMHEMLGVLVMCRISVRILNRIKTK